MQKELSSLTQTISQKRSELISIDEELLFESFALYKPHYKFQSSDEYRSKLFYIRDKQKQMIKSNTAAKGNLNWTVNNSLAQGRKMVTDMIKLVIRSFNNECDYCIDNVKFNNIESCEKRISQSCDVLNKLGQLMQVSITPEYKKLKFDELYLAHEYQLKKQEEKEEQKRVREELREQQKLEQEIKAAREKILKERKHFTKAISDLKLTIANASGDELKQLNKKISELQSQLDDLEKEERKIDYREQNAKAGYVYVISNIGAFGEGIFKIGMTRRLEPQDRVDELGDASVPFGFDVHTMIFSDNAPELESKLYRHFYENRLNKLNNRKEFFRANIDEISQVIRSNYDKIVDIEKIAPAEQYRESLKFIDERTSALNTEINKNMSNQEPIKMSEECAQIENEINNKLPTQEELEAFESIKRTLMAFGKDINNMSFKNSASEFTILINDDSKKWILKFNTDSENKYLITQLPDTRISKLCDRNVIKSLQEGISVSKIILNNYSDVKSLKSLVVTCFDEATKSE